MTDAINPARLMRSPMGRTPRYTIDDWPRSWAGRCMMCVASSDSWASRDPSGDEAVFNSNATRGRRPSHSALCC